MSDVFKYYFAWWPRKLYRLKPDGFIEDAGYRWLDTVCLRRVAKGYSASPDGWIAYEDEQP